MNKLIFDKTDKGREEIVTRKYRLASRLRSLLVLVDGKKTTPELLIKVAGLGLDAAHLTELIDGEYIAEISVSDGNDDDTAEPPPQSAAAFSDEPAPASAAASENEASINLTDAPDQAIADSDAPLTKPMAAAQSLALRSFFTETIKSTLGFRGFTMQLKVERASTLEDFQNLRQPYLDAVQKAKGQETMASLRDRLDQLLLDAKRSMQ